MARANSKLKDQVSVESALVNRVVSTPSWPVPYYQRIQKAYPIRENKPVDLSHPDYPIDILDWWATREVLQSQSKCRELVHYFENNVKTNTFLIHNNDCTGMSRAFTEDLAGFIDVANQENKRILKDDLL